MTDFYAAGNARQANEIQRQQIDANERIASEAKRVLEENARARDIQTKAYNAPQAYKTIEIPNEMPAAAPQGMIPTQATPQLIPQAGATGLGGMTTPQQAPVGMQPTENLGGMQPIGMAQPIAPTGTQPTTEVTPSTPITRATASAKVYQTAESEMDKALRVADELRKNGLPDQANAYLEKQTGLIKNVEAAKKTHLENTAALAEHVAGLGNSFLEAVKNGGDPNAAWSQMLIKASAEGYPIEDLLTIVDPKERMVKANQIVDEAETTKQRALMATAVLKAQTQADNTNKLIRSRENLSAARNRLTAASQEAVQLRHLDNMGWKDYNATKDKIKFTIDTLETERTSLATELNSNNMRLAALKAGNALTITGGKMTEADRIAEISSLEDTVDNLTKHREQLTSTINEYSKTAAGLKTPTSKETKPEVTSTLDTSKYNFTKEADAATREGYKKVMAHAKSMLKTNPQEAERIQKEAQKRMIDAKLLVKAS